MANTTNLLEQQQFKTIWLPEPTLAMHVATQRYYGRNNNNNNNKESLYTIQLPACRHTQTLIKLAKRGAHKRVVDDVKTFDRAGRRRTCNILPKVTCVPYRFGYIMTS